MKLVEKWPMTSVGIVTILLATTISYGVDYYVAPDAAAGGDGSVTTPFKTIEQARDAILITNGNIILRGGIYELTNSFLLGSIDSGQADNPVIYQSYPNEHPRLIGGKMEPT